MALQQRQIAGAKWAVISVFRFFTPVTAQCFQRLQRSHQGTGIARLDGSVIRREQDGVAIALQSQDEQAMRRDESARRSAHSVSPLGEW